MPKRITRRTFLEQSSRAAMVGGSLLTTAGPARAASQAPQGLRRAELMKLFGSLATTLFGDHESIIVLGAAGHAAMSRTADLIETANTDLYQVGLLGTWGQRKIREFQARIKRLRASSARMGPSWRTGWALDKWDEGKTHVRDTYG